MLALLLLALRLLRIGNYFAYSGEEAAYRIWLHVLDEPAVILKKFKRAVTDSGTEIVAREDKPGITNLLQILSAVTGASVPELEARYVGKQYGTFKIEVAESVIEYLRPIRERYNEIAGDLGALTKTFERGAQRARAVAAPILAEVKERVGLV